MTAPAAAVFPSAAAGVPLPTVLATAAASTAMAVLTAVPWQSWEPPALRVLLVVVYGASAAVAAGLALSRLRRQP